MPKTVRAWDVSYASRKRAASRPKAATRRSGILGVRSRVQDPFPTTFTERARKRTRTRGGMRMRGRTSAARRVRGARKMAAALGNPRRYAYKRSRLTRRGLQTKMLFPTAIVRCQGIAKELQAPDFSTGTTLPGYYNINTGVSAASTIDQSARPVYAVTLNLVNNVSNDGPVVTQMQIADDATPTWAIRQSQNQNGNNNNSLYYNEDIRFMSGDSAPAAQYIQHLWYDMRFKLYGARKQAVTYDVYLVKFREGHFIPAVFREQSDPALWPASELSEYRAFWQNFSRNISYNSILPGAGGWKKHVRVLRHRRVVLSASTSDDLDTLPDNVDFKWFVRDGRVQSYQETNQPFTDQAAIEGAGWNVYSNVTGSTKNRPAYEKGSLFLLIRATDMSASIPATAEDADDNPSFDMCIRKKFVAYPRAT